MLSKPGACDGGGVFHGFATRRSAPGRPRSRAIATIHVADRDVVLGGAPAAPVAPADWALSGWRLLGQRDRNGISVHHRCALWPQRRRVAGRVADGYQRRSLRRASDRTVGHRRPAAAGPKRTARGDGRAGPARDERDERDRGATGPGPARTTGTGGQGQFRQLDVTPWIRTSGSPDPPRCCSIQLGAAIWRTYTRA
jgi:hypothetical protein